MKLKHIVCKLLGIAVALWPTATAAQALPFSDNFRGKTLNPGWTVSSLNPDSFVGLTGQGVLRMTASPLKGGSDLWPQTNYNAPFILQPISAMLDWTIKTQIKFAPTKLYQGAGILLATQPGPFTDYSQFSRITERAYDTNSSYVQKACMEAITYCVPFSGTTTYFRVSKKGLVYTGYVGENGKDWTMISQETIATRFTYVGLYSIRQPWDGDDTVSSVADFDYFAYE